MTLHPFNAICRAGQRWPSLLLAVGALLAVGPVCAVGSTVDVQVIERDTGTTLPVYPHQGSQYVAGRPGARYAIRISNRSGGRVLAVMSVDGVNIVSGQTAAWNQGGYVLEPWQTHEITGWRKSPREVAAFEFTALPDSYAARTGRPNDVGVIGVAVFTERPANVRPAPPVSRNEPRAPFDDQRGRYEEPMGESRARSQSGAAASAEKAAPAPSQDAAQAAGRRSAPEAEERLGTGHGAREASYSSTTHFVRSTRPVELVSIRYDRYDNLVRAGVIGGDWTAPPRPFPRSGTQGFGFVPDPPVW